MRQLSGICDMDTLVKTKCLPSLSSGKFSAIAVATAVCQQVFFPHLETLLKCLLKNQLSAPILFS